jgi:hypothetical protein
MQGLPMHAPLVFPLSRSLNVAANIKVSRRGIASGDLQGADTSGTDMRWQLQD